MKLRNLLFCIILIISGLTNSQAQNYSVLTTIDSSSIQVGDPIRLRFEINAPKDVRIKLPSAGDALSGHIEVLKKLQVDSANLAKRVWIMQVTSFDSGTQVIPSLPFVFISSTKNDTLYSDSLKIEVSLLPTDSTKVIADIKPPVDVPLTFKEVLPYLLVGLGILIVLAIILWLIYRLRSKKSLIPSFKKIDPPHVRALQNLQKLKEEKLWQNGFVKEYYTQMSDIIRLYLEERFDIQALEQTTSEIMSQIEYQNHLVDYKRDIYEILEMSDLAKFAKVLPEEKDNVHCMDLAVAFVEKTVPSVNNTDIKNDNTLIINEK